MRTCQETPPRRTARPTPRRPSSLPGSAKPPGRATKGSTRRPRRPPTRRPGVFDRLFDGSLTLDDYARWHAQQYFVYEAIEAAAERFADDAVAGPFVFPELARLPAIEADLRVPHGSEVALGYRTAPGDPRLRGADRRGLTAERPRRLYRPRVHPLSRRPLRRPGVRQGRQAQLRLRRRGRVLLRLHRHQEPQGVQGGVPRAPRRGRPARGRQGPRHRGDPPRLRPQRRGARGPRRGLGRNPFEPKVIAAICHHMNHDHADDTLVICRGVGRAPGRRVGPHDRLRRRRRGLRRGRRRGRAPDPQSTGPDRCPSAPRSARRSSGSSPSRRQPSLRASLVSLKA